MLEKVNINKKKLETSITTMFNVVFQNISIIQIKSNWVLPKYKAIEEKTTVVTNQLKYSRKSITAIIMSIE